MTDPYRTPGRDAEQSTLTRAERYERAAIRIRAAMKRPWLTKREYNRLRSLHARAKQMAVLCQTDRRMVIGSIGPGMFEKVFGFRLF